MLYTGPDGTSSPRWAKTTTYLFGCAIVEERPAYGCGSISNTHHYSDAGLLAKSTSPGQAPTLYEYDELGELIRTALDLNTNDAIDLAGPDRVTGNGLLVSSESRTGVETTYAYDPLERRIRSETVGGSRSVASATAYNSKGQIAYTEDAAITPQPAAAHP